MAKHVGKKKSQRIIRFRKTKIENNKTSKKNMHTVLYRRYNVNVTDNVDYTN